MRVGIFGASGLLGSSLVIYLKRFGYETVSIGRSQQSDYICDVRCVTAVSKALRKTKPNIILNLVAMTDVEACEKKPSEAYCINTKVVENIVQYINKSNDGAYLIQISTDQFYDGKMLNNEDNLNILNYYAFSKYAGELIASSVPSVILRTNFFGKSLVSDRQSFSDWTFENLKNKNKFLTFHDVYFNPVSIKTLCLIILEIMVKRPLGIYNVGSRCGLSKAEFVLNFAKESNIKCSSFELVSVTDVDFIRAARPKDMRFSVSKIECLLGYKMPSLKNEIKSVVGEYVVEAIKDIRNQ